MAHQESTSQQQRSKDKVEDPHSVSVCVTTIYYPDPMPCRSVVSKYRLATRRTYHVAPPNTAANPSQTHHRSPYLSPPPQPPPFHFQPLNSVGTKSPSHKATLNVSLPAPPPSSPTFHPHERLAKNKKKREQASYSGLPLESCTFSVDPNSSQLRHSLCVNLSSLQQETAAASSPKNHRKSAKSKRKSSLSHIISNERGKHLTGKKASRDTFVAEPSKRSMMSVLGQKEEVRAEDKSVERVAQAKKEEGKQLRREEEQIMKTLGKNREPLSKDLRKVPPPTTIHGAPRLSKDALAFGRVFQSVNLSTLKAVERIHEMEGVREDWERKAAHVERIRVEREIRRQKIQDIRQRTKETVEAWRIAEENKIARLRDENAKLTVESILERSLRRSDAGEHREREARDQSFAAEFVKQTVSVGREVAKDDQESTTEEKRKEIKRQVEQATELARHRRQEAKSEREIRDTRLVWEGALAKKELSGRVMNAAVQRLSDSKRRVGRAINRRAAARASVERAREALRSRAARAASTPRGTTTLPPLKLDLRSETELVEACRNTMEAVVTAEVTTSAPYRLRQFTHEANRTWQRGTLVLEERERQSLEGALSQHAESHNSCFPTIKESAKTYHQLKPGRIYLRSRVSTPFQSEVTDSSPSAETPTDSFKCGTWHHPVGVV